MQREESQLIEGLFDRLKTTEAQTAPRDREAEALIQQRLREQPAAPYYMAQAMLIQEAAIKRLDQRVKELEGQMAQVQQNRPSSGGFLSWRVALAKANGSAGSWTASIRTRPPTGGP